MKLILKSKRKVHYAEALYDNNQTIVLKGAQINPVDSFPGMSEIIKELRSDKTIVSDNGLLLKDLPFSSPSSAAQFVTGRSVNGYIAWRPDDKMSLKAFLKKSNFSEGK